MTNKNDLLSGYDGSHKYDPNSDRTIAGEDFQYIVMDEIQSALPNITIESAREWIKETYDPKTVRDLNRLEKRHGDITFKIGDNRIFIECFLSMGRSSRFDELKRLSFSGSHRFYCLGVRNRDGELDHLCYVPSNMWSKYLDKCPMGEDEGWFFRRIGQHLIGPNLQIAWHSTSEFLRRALGLRNIKSFL